MSSECGNINIYKKKNVQSSNALARKAALEKKQENPDSVHKVNKQIESRKQSQKKMAITPNENKDYDEVQTTDVRPDDREAPLPAEADNIETEKEQPGLIHTLKQRFQYNYSKERKVEKIISIDIDLNMDGYYDDVVGKEPCISEGTDLYTVLKIMGSIFGFIGLLIFLINWL